MTKTIFTVSVHVKNQEHADNLKKICIQNDLSIDDEGGFAYHKKYGCEFYYLKTKKVFTVLYDSLNEKVKDSEFIELLSKYRENLSKQKTP